MRTSANMAPALAGPRKTGGQINFADVLYGTLGRLTLAVFVAGLPVTFHLAGQAFGLTICIILALIVANFAPCVVPIVLIFSYQFQNLFVALVSPHIDSLDQLNSIRAYSFVFTAGVWLVLAASYWMERPRVDRRMRLLMDVTTVALALIALYFALGVLSNPANALVYLRNIAAPFLLIQIFAIVSYRHGASVLSAVMLTGVLVLIYGYLELFGQEQLLRIVNGDTYLTWRMKQDHEAGVWLRDLQETGRVMRSYLDTLLIDFLNTPFLLDLGVRLSRLVGPNFHSISFAYALAFFGVVLWAAGRHWYAILVFPLVVVIGSKGALVLLVFVTASLVLIRRFPWLRRLWFYAAMLCVYAAVGIAVGIATQDYHVIGFLGGLRGFLSNPFGHGIGAGGNLSLNVSAIDWSRSQSIGHTDVAVESAVGVLLYQMGVAGIVLLAVIAWIAVKLWAIYRGTGDRFYAAGAIGTLTILVNGIFQEEALFAPLALGVMAALAGLMLGNAYRDAPSRASAARSSKPPPYTKLAISAFPKP
jgi:hypothetical protein